MEEVGRVGEILHKKCGLERWWIWLKSGRPKFKSEGKRVGSGTLDETVRKCSNKRTRKPLCMISESTVEVLKLCVKCFQS